MLNSSRDKNEGMCHSGEGGGRARYVTPDLWGVLRLLSLATVASLAFL